MPTSRGGGRRRLRGSPPLAPAAAQRIYPGQLQRALPVGPLGLGDTDQDHELVEVGVPAPEACELCKDASLLGLLPSPG